MNRYHSPHHWIWVAIVLAIALLTLSNAHGQRTDSSATFEGRPAVAGANAGTGAMAGPPQGGLGAQGQDQSQINVRPWSSGVADMPHGGTVAPSTDTISQNRAVRDDRDVIDRDKGMARDQRGVLQKLKDAIKRIVQGKRHGVNDVQSADD